MKSISHKKNSRAPGGKREDLRKDKGIFAVLLVLVKVEKEECSGKLSTFINNSQSMPFFFFRRADRCVHLQSKARSLTHRSEGRCGSDYTSSRCPVSSLNIQGAGEVRQNNDSSDLKFCGSYLRLLNKINR